MLTVTPLLDSLDALDPAYYPYMDGLDMAPKVLARHGPVPWGGEYLAVNHALKNVRVNPARCPKASVPRRGAGPGARR